MVDRATSNAAQSAKSGGPPTVAASAFMTSPRRWTTLRALPAPQFFLEVDENFRVRELALERGDAPVTLAKFEQGFFG
jgi:hypothetical protein